MAQEGVGHRQLAVEYLVLLTANCLPLFYFQISFPY